MNLIEKATVMHYHRHRIEQFESGTIKALGWRGEASQRERFRVLAGVGDLTGCSVLDAGCGHGDLKDYLDQRYSDFAYIGIDQMPEFIAEARARHAGRPDTYFYQADFTDAALPPVDYVLACGALGYRCENAWFYVDMIRKLYDAAKVALAFNMLDAERFAPHDFLMGHDREGILAFCRSLAPRVELISGYLDDDFTVFVYRDSL